jgi:tRNA G18 (ribose-2'-O)-methylase SpoU
VFRKLKNEELDRPTIEEFKDIGKTPVIIILDNVRSRHNIGSVFRSCDAFAAESLLLCGICATPPSSEIRKAALGAEESMEWHYFKKTEEAVIFAREKGYKIISVEQTENSVMLDKFIPEEKSGYAFVFGNEVKGVSQSIIDISDMVLEIPQFGTKHSLNIAVSAGIVIWDIFNKLDSTL